MSDFRSALSALKRPPERASRVFASPSQSSTPTPGPNPGFSWTPEQHAAIVSQAPLLRLTALAGCGKSRVLSEYARRRPRQKWQYLAFNKAMAVEASASFPSNVRACTFHAWAWPRFGLDIAHKMDAVWDQEAVATMLHLPLSAPWVAGYLALQQLALDRFIRSDADRPSRHHIPPEEWALWRQTPGAGNALDIDRAVEHLSMLWFDSQSPAGLVVPASPDTAIKRAQLGRMEALAPGLLVDEAQDLSPAMLAWVDQSVRLRVRAGDPYQTLYAWRAGGAGQWEMPGEQGLSLTASHRFGPELQDWVNPVLAALGSREALVGAAPSTRIHTDVIQERHWVLGRTRAALLDEAARLQAQGVAVCWRGDQQFDRIAQLQALARGDTGSLRDPWLRSFPTLDAFVEAASNAGMSDWVQLASRVASNQMQVDPSCFVAEDQAQVVLSTVHQTKGMSLDRVRLLDDVFADATSAEELRVRYVALTRARKEISLPINARMDEPQPMPEVVVPLAGDGF